MYWGFSSGRSGHVAVTFMSAVSQLLPPCSRRNLLLVLWVGAPAHSRREPRDGVPPAAKPPSLRAFGTIELPPKTVVQSAPASYASADRAVNFPPALPALEAGFFLTPVTCEEMDKIRARS